MYLHVKYTVYKHFGRSLHIGSLDPNQVQNFRPASLTVFEILGFKLKNENDKIFLLVVCVCCCLQTCNSVVNMLVTGLVLRQSLMVIGILLYSKVSLLYNVLWECILVVYT